MMRILVTGGAGYVGSALVPELLRRGHQVLVLDWFLFPSERPFMDSQNLRLLVGDVRNPGDLRAAMKGVDVVMHLAAMSNDPSGDLDRNLTTQINFEATRLAIELAQEMGVTRFIYASSASVYGICDAEKVVESIPFNPQTIYAETKALSEEVVVAANSGTFTTVCVRPATLNGYADRLRLDLTANIFTAQALMDHEIRVFGGGQYRPNLSVADMVHFYMLLLGAQACDIGARSFNVVEADYRVFDIAKIVQSVVAPACALTIVPSKDTRSYRLCGDLARDVLHFKAGCTLAESVRKLAAVLRRWGRAQMQSPQYRNVEWLKSKGTPRMEIT